MMLTELDVALQLVLFYQPIYLLLAVLHNNGLRYSGSFYIELYVIGAHEGKMNIWLVLAT
jgi:hypothetical protein